MVILTPFSPLIPHGSSGLTLATALPQESPLPQASKSIVTVEPSWLHFRLLVPHSL
jgi:hypothetical protein